MRFRYFLLTILLILPIFGNAQTPYSELAEQYAEQGNYEQAINLELEGLQLLEQLKGRENEEYINSLLKIAEYYRIFNNYSEAVISGLEALKISEEIYGNNHPIYATILSYLAEYNSDLSNYQESVRLGTEALTIREGVLGKKHQDYAASLINLASYNSKLGNYQEAISLGTEALKIFEEIFGKNHSLFAISLNNLAGFHYHLGNYKEAIKLVSEALKIIEEIFGKSHPDYTTSLNNLALYNSYLGDYPEAIRLGTEVLEIWEENFGKKNSKYATFVGNLAAYHSYLGNYQEALKLDTEALRIIEEIYGKAHSAYAIFLNYLALNYSDLGYYQEAIKFGTEALKICEMIHGTNHPDYAVFVSNMAGYYSELHIYNEAISLLTEALKISEKNFGKKHLEYAVSLSNLALYNSYLGNYHEAIRIGTEVLKIWEEIFGKNHPNYATSLHNLSGYYSCFGNFQEAIRLETEALNIQEKIFGKCHRDYALSLNNLAFYISKLGDYKGAIRLGTEVLKIWKEILGMKCQDYAGSLENLISYYDLINDESNITLNAVEAFQIERELLSRNFNFLTKTERDLYWNKSSFYMTNSLPKYIYKYTSKELVDLGYNASLLSKGVILNSEIEFDKFLAETGSPELAKKYNDIKNLRLQLNKLYEKPIAERFIDTDSLERQANELERQLMQESAEFGDYTRNLSITWQDVQKGLKKKDAAIEFVSFPLNNDSTMYMAYVLRPDMEAPELVKLFEEMDLTTLYPKNQPQILYKKKEASDLIWRKFEPYLEGVDNVYFAPDGLLHQIGIEYFLAPESEQTMNEKYNMYRLSSTRQLALDHERKNVEKAVLYGGIEFDSGIETMKEENRKYGLMASTDRGGYFGDDMAEDFKLRAHYEPLPGTRIEVENIERMLKQNKKQTELFTGDEASEASFKSLTGKHPQLLHIATHGFYWDEEQADRMAVDNEKLMFMSSLGDTGPRYVEDKALTRSGLLMAGANNTLRRKSKKTGEEDNDVPEDIENGILTAQEISQMNLRDLDLVVLSACQTGLGEIGSDGVFGLQRGFKKAGANTILMSLWEVNDEATQLLMTEFYKNYLSGKSKRESLLEAQKALRSNSKYNDPKYWAAFILLDALN